MEQKVWLPKLRDAKFLQILRDAKFLEREIGNTSEFEQFETKIIWKIIKLAM